MMKLSEAECGVSKQMVRGLLELALLDGGPINELLPAAPLARARVVSLL